MSDFKPSCRECVFQQDKCCHRFPPQASIVMIPKNDLLTGKQSFAPTPIACFPQIDPKGWCGEWASLPEATH